jgi:hypothetical protein
MKVSVPQGPENDRRVGHLEDDGDGDAAGEQNPYKDSNEYCTIEVRFSGNVSRGTPQFESGPNHTRLGDLK